ncbi:MAG: acetyl-CoA C-acyltransferase, partial [Burkholderiales bacterium]
HDPGADGLAGDFAAKAGLGDGPWPRNVLEHYGVPEFSQFTGAEMIADKYGLSRDDLDRYALESHRRAAAATQAGAFADEILRLPFTGADGQTHWHEADEGIRYDASLEQIGAVDAIIEGGKISAAASQICDGASGVMIVSEAALKAHGFTPLARIHSFVVTAGDPVIMLEEPIPATSRALAKAGMSIDDIDLFEVNEAFAPIPLAWLKATGADPARTNAFGGAIALGHPLGASGTKLMTTLVHGLRRTGKRWGLQTMCEGGGIANVTILEAL